MIYTYTTLKTQQCRLTGTTQPYSTTARETMRSRKGRGSSLIRYYFYIKAGKFNNRNQAVIRVALKPFL